MRHQQIALNRNMELPIRNELTNNGQLIQLANHYTARGAQLWRK